MKFRGALTIFFTLIFTWSCQSVDPLVKKARIKKVKIILESYSDSLGSSLMADDEDQTKNAAFGMMKASCDECGKNWIKKILILDVETKKPMFEFENKKFDVNKKNISFADSLIKYDNDELGILKIEYAT